MKKFFLIILILVLVLAAGTWYLRNDILRFSANMILKRVLPGNLVIEKVVVDLSKGKLELENLSLRNPVGFQDLYFADVPLVSIGFRMKGKTILTGIEVTSLELTDPIISIERLITGRVNSEEIEMAPPGGTGAVMPIVEIRRSSGKVDAGSEEGIARSLSDAVALRGHLPGKLTGGKIVFRDEITQGQRFTATLENMDSVFRFLLDDDYEITYVETDGTGLVNGDASQKLKWKISMDLVSSDITMSNRIEPDNVDVVFFKPYYDRFSPIDIKKGRVSGTIVFDLHAGNIGSDNILRFNGLEFTEKNTASASIFWDASVTDIVKYLESSSGETVFDFKIKGPINNPRFFPGPNVARAIRNLAVDKIGEMLNRNSQPAQTAEGTETKSDVDKVLDVFTELMKK